MHRKLICTIASVAMLAGLLFIGAAPAYAAPPQSANNFNPQDSTLGPGADDLERLVLTDKFDGVDTLAHFSSVATTDATQAFYVVCPQGTDPVTDPADNPVPPSGCQTVGNDTTGTVPSNTATGQPNLDEAYESFWDIPSTFDNITRDILVYHCNGSPTANEPGGNCVLEIEPDVFIDDASTATSTTAAEYLDYCVDFTGDQDCADANETREPFGHGTTIPNLQSGEELLVRARSSDDGITTLTSCLDDQADATAGSLDSCSVSDSSGGQAAQAFKNYTFVYGDLEVPDSAEMGFFLHNLADDGSGACSTAAGDPNDCLFDSHYIVSTAREARNAVLTFENLELSRAENCASPDDAETNDLGDFESVLFCVADQFGEPISTDVTFQSSGVSTAGFDSGLDCTAMNHDGSADGVDEHCDGATAADGIAQAVLQNPDDASPTATPGDQIVTACVEGEPVATDPNHGCADESLVDSVTKTWESVANTVRLVFGDKSTDCFTGPTFKENNVGDVDDLLACVFDGFGNPTSTTGDDDGFLEWSIGTGGDDDVDTQFVGVPPSETDAEGEAVAQIEAVDPGSDDPTVCLRDNQTGDIVDCDSVSKNVKPDDGEIKDPSTVNIRHRSRPHRFTGSVNSPNDSCEVGRTVVVKRQRRGPDQTIGQDTTNANGNYRIGHNRTRNRRTYYARLRSTDDCTGDRSNNIRKR